MLASLPEFLAHAAGSALRRGLGWSFSGVELYAWELLIVAIDLCLFALPFLGLAFAYRDLVSAKSRTVAAVFD